MTFLPDQSTSCLLHSLVYRSLWSTAQHFVALSFLSGTLGPQASLSASASPLPFLTASPSKASCLLPRPQLIAQLESWHQLSLSPNIGPQFLGLQCDTGHWLIQKRQDFIYLINPSVPTEDSRKEVSLGMQSCFQLLRPVVYKAYKLTLTTIQHCFESPKSQRWDKAGLHLEGCAFHMSVQLPCLVPFSPIMLREVKVQK